MNIPLADTSPYNIIKISFLKGKFSPIFNLSAHTEYVSHLIAVGKKEKNSELLT